MSCLCGQASAELSKRPDFIFECNCTLCSKSGARWGYFHPSEVTLAGQTSAYRRSDKDDPSSEIHFCATCGATTHFSLTEAAIARFGNTMMGVNMWLADEGDLTGIELRYPNGKGWSGQGDFTFVREPRVLGRAAGSD